MAVSPPSLKPYQDLTKDPFHLLFTLPFVERDKQTGEYVGGRVKKWSWEKLNVQKLPCIEGRRV